MMASHPSHIMSKEGFWSSDERNCFCDITLSPLDFSEDMVCVYQSFNCWFWKLWSVNISYYIVPLTHIWHHAYMAWLALIDFALFLKFSLFNVSLQKKLLIFHEVPAGTKYTDCNVFFFKVKSTFLKINLCTFSALYNVAIVIITVGISLYILTRLL